jgi:hypothetical protein
MHTTSDYWDRQKHYLLKPTFMHYDVYIKSHTNFHSDAFHSENQYVI